MRQPIPESTVAMLCFVGMIVVGWFIVRHIGNVEPGVRRRILQNFVYRLYEYQRWILAIVRGIDAFVDAYYTTQSRTRIKPVNERKFAPVYLIEPKEATPVPVPATIDRGWNWRKLSNNEDKAASA